MKIIDCHVHMYRDPAAIPTLDRVMKESGFDAVCLVSIPACNFKDDCYFSNDLVLEMKRKHPGKCYAFPGLDYREMLGGRFDSGNLLEQAKKLVEQGADGFKMLEGKPCRRKQIGLPLDSEILDPFYSFAEDNGLPLLLHVADPEEFWMKDKAPPSAFKHGWFWGDGSYASKEQLYSEAEGAIGKHPRLKFILAHFFFLSADIGRARRFLQKYPNVSFDITPGIEMYHNFSKKHSEWREFFIEFQDRILFGTDNRGNSVGEPKEEDFAYEIERLKKMNTFLSSDAEVYSGRGINLPDPVLEKIYSKNFLLALKR